jgi:hypothetical protein
LQFSGLSVHKNNTGNDSGDRITVQEMLKDRVRRVPESTATLFDGPEVWRNSRFLPEALAEPSNANSTHLQ